MHPSKHATATGVGISTHQVAPVPNYARSQSNMHLLPHGVNAATASCRRTRFFMVASPWLLFFPKMNTLCNHPKLTTS